MKRIFLAVAVFLFATTMYAQSGSGALPNSSETKQNAQQYSSQAKSNSSQFESDLADLNARNVSNRDLDTFNRLKSEIEQLESQITVEQKKVRPNLERGRKIPNASLDRIDRLIKLHQAKIAELDAFAAGS